MEFAMSMSYTYIHKVHTYIGLVNKRLIYTKKSWTDAKINRQNNISKTEILIIAILVVILIISTIKDES